MRGDPPMLEPEDHRRVRALARGRGRGERRRRTLLEWFVDLITGAWLSS